MQIYNVPDKSMNINIDVDADRCKDAILDQDKQWFV